MSLQLPKKNIQYHDSCNIILKSKLVIHIVYTNFIHN